VVGRVGGDRAEFLHERREGEIKPDRLKTRGWSLIPFAFKRLILSS
jgi:hypothetical protein